MTAKKPLMFGVRGAVGCLVAAVLGELFLDATKTPAVTPPPTPPQALSVVIDCSGSMWGNKLAEVKAAAVQFARRQDLSEDKIAVVEFSSQARTAVDLTDDLWAIERAIQGLRNTAGGTRMDRGLEAAMGQLKESTIRRNVLLFTDGEPNDKERTKQVAKICRDAGIRIVAVATDDANIAFLSELTGDSSLVFWADAGNYGEGFERAEKVIYGPRSIVETATTDEAAAEPIERLLLRIGGWTALLAIGISLALIIGQNRDLRRRFIGPGQAFVAIVGAVIAGGAAGAAGQLFFSQATQYPSFELIGRIVAWALLGALLGFGVSLFVPNLKFLKGLIAGLLGGALGGAGFIWASGAVGDVAGRLSGAAILGFCIGMMIALVEVALRQAWLKIGYGKGEFETVTVGKTPVTIGSDAKCTIWSREAPPVAYEFAVEGEQVVCRDMATDSTSPVHLGEERTAGKVTVTVCGRG